VDSRDTRIRSGPRHQDSWWIGLGVTTVLFGALLVAFVPYWESNDDVGMAMLAHGFGLAAQDSPRLIFSNVVWGWLVRSVPGYLNTLGYAWATLAVLFGVCVVIFRAVDKVGHGVGIACLVLVAVTVRPLLFPQFTINSGLLCVCAIAAWRCYAHNVAARERRAWVDLTLGCLLAFLSYIVRSQEFLLVAAVGAPLIPWRALVGRRPGQVALTVLAVAVSVASFADRRSYASNEWAAFQVHNAARAPFTDFGAGGRLKQHPEIFERHGFSSNDIDLVSYWFFVDAAVVEPLRLEQMLRELGPRTEQLGDGQHALSGLRILFEPVLLPLFAMALLLVLLNCSARLLAVWILCLGAAIAMGWLGRPGVARVYVPLAALLVVAPWLLSTPVAGWRRRASIAVLAVGTAVNAAQVFSESRATHVAAIKLHQSMVGLPPQVVVVWGDSFPYPLAYPVVGRSFADGFRFYGLGVFTRAPVSTAFALERQNDGLVRRLQSTGGLNIIADLHWLKIYCEEHLGVKLVTLETTPFSGFTLQRVRCAAPELAPYAANTTDKP
jgi:hypothetical protein